MLKKLCLKEQTEGVKPFPKVGFLCVLQWQPDKQKEQNIFEDSLVTYINPLSKARQID